MLRWIKGLSGGYIFARPAERITLLEVIEARDGPTRAPHRTGCTRC
jgi:DNA-binding IscR family transcriptional regulator